MTKFIQMTKCSVRYITLAFKSNVVESVNCSVTLTYTNSKFQSAV